MAKRTYAVKEVKKLMRRAADVSAPTAQGGGAVLTTTSHRLDGPEHTDKAHVGNLWRLVEGGTVAPTEGDPPTGEVVVQVKTTAGAPTHTATRGTPCWVAPDLALYVNDDGATSWSRAGVGDHGDLSGLADDDHLQYAPVHLEASADPTVADDDTAGYRVGGRWINLATAEEFVLVDDTTGAAVWASTTSLGSGSLPTPSAKGDLAVWDGSAWVILPAGTDGDVLTADSGASSGLSYQTPATGGGGGGGFVWPLDDNTLHATYGDDFDGASLAAKWTRHNVTSGAETYQAGGDGSWLDVAVPATTYDQSYFQPAPAGDFEVQFKQELYSAATHMYGVMIIDSTGAGVGVCPYDNGNVVFMANLSAYQYSTSQGSDNLYGFEYIRGGVMWLAIKKVGTVYTFRFSRNGQVWTPYATGVTNAFTVNRIGFGRYYGGGSGHHLRAGRFNVV